MSVSASNCTIPDISMSADIPTKAITIIMVLRICTRVWPSNVNCLLVVTPCICPPIKAPAKNNKLNDGINTALSCGNTKGESGQHNGNNKGKQATFASGPLAYPHGYDQYNHRQ